MVSDAPIGIFDSGVGGLTVARSIMDLLPGEEIRYVGDTAHTPYGEKPIAKVRQYSLEILDSLVDQGVKMLVIACNTASSAMLHDARERYSERAGIPVIEVIRPAVRQAIATTRNRIIGVIGTETTINSGAYQDALGVVAGIEVHTAACPRFVEFAERGITSGQEVLDVARGYLQHLGETGVDTLVLGCTHYPLLAGPISYVMGPNVSLVTSNNPTARDVYAELTRTNNFRSSPTPPQHSFTATGPSVTFMHLARQIIGPSMAGID